MKFELRDWKLDDAENLVRYANNPKVACLKYLPITLHLDDAHRFIDQCMHRDQTKQSIKAIVIDNEPIGSVGLLLPGRCQQ